MNYPQAAAFNGNVRNGIIHQRSVAARQLTRFGIGRNANLGGIETGFGSGK